MGHLVGFARRKVKIEKRVRPRNLDLDCPSCGGRNVFRSRSKTAFERFLRATRFVSYCRCHSCGWRGKRIAIRREVVLAALLLLASLFVLALLTRPAA